MLEINGRENGSRIASKDMDERIQSATGAGEREIRIYADGQHGIGGRIWPNGERVRLEVDGAPGQRLGAMGMMGTEIKVNGSSSDDVGWINCGAEITVLGDVANGAHNAGAQGKLYVQGGGGARCDTLTKFNPRFDPIQSWYFRDVGDSFAEFKAGGIAVVCGVNPRNPHSVLGYRPCVGMVGGTIYFRGPTSEVSSTDARVTEMTDADWEWLCENMPPFLEAVDRASFFSSLTKSREEWRKIVALTPEERVERAKSRMPMEKFRKEIWEEGVGAGGIFGEYIQHDQTLLPFITQGDERRFAPSWNNNQFAPPCAGYCPTGIPTHERTKLLRQERDEEALDLVLEYSPFPGTVCGYVCPNICMDYCSRTVQFDDPVDVSILGRASLERPAPEKSKSRAEKVAVLGGGPGGISAAYQLVLKGYYVSLYEREDSLGGKIYYCIPEDRLPNEILGKELERFANLGVDIHTGVDVTKDKFREIYKENDVVIVATGSHSPRTIPFPGYENVMPGIVFLKEITAGNPRDLSGKSVVVIGAGNVGMDICVEAYNCGAEQVVAVDIQKPASFGKEQKLAESKGTQIMYPKFTERYEHEEGVIYFKDGTSLKADLAIISIGETPELDYLPEGFDFDRGFLKVDKVGQTTDPKVYAIGDATKPGLITNSIGDGLRVASYVHALLSKTEYDTDERRVIPYENLSFQWYERSRTDDLTRTCSTESSKCMSCGSCRDCHICEQNCYWNAISRREFETGDFEYVVDAERCIGCGFCVGSCPCGIWEITDKV